MGELEVSAIERHATLENIQRERGRELRSGEREPQAIAGHGIDKAGRVAGEQQSWNAGRAPVNGHRSKDRRAGYGPRAIEPCRQLRIFAQALT